MSKNYKLPESRQSRNPSARFRLVPDAIDGFKTAANNNQPRIGMEYLIHFVELTDDHITRLTEMVEELVEKVEALSKTKGTASKAAAVNAE